jgi:glycosyltransferase involved in cell wall biosynthesis
VRVAYLCADPGVPVFGQKGCSVHVQEVIRALRKRGAIVTLIARRIDGEPPAGLADVRVVKLPKLAKEPAEDRERAAIDGNTEVERLLVEDGPFDLVYERYSLWSYRAMEWARERGIPGLLEVNAPLIEEQSKYRALVQQAEAERIARRVFGAATACLAVSEPVAEYVRKASPGARAEVVPNGVNVERFIQADLGATDGKVNVVFVGTLKPWHGVQHLVLALSRLKDPNIRVTIIGDGPERAGIEEQVRSLGLEGRVTMTGALEPAAVPAQLAKCQIAVAPYPALDGFYFSPLKLYEYMAAGLPVVASEVGEIPDVVTHGRTGLLYSPGDLGGLARHIQFLASNETIRRAFGNAARRQAEERHTWDAVADRILGHTRLREAAS